VLPAKRCTKVPVRKPRLLAAGPQPPGAIRRSRASPSSTSLHPRAQQASPKGCQRTLRGTGEALKTPQGTTRRAAGTRAPPSWGRGGRCQGGLSQSFAARLANRDGRGSTPGLLEAAYARRVAMGSVTNKAQSLIRPTLLLPP
jgi:hypothetical protein